MQAVKNAVVTGVAVNGNPKEMFFLTYQLISSACRPWDGLEELRA